MQTAGVEVHDLWKKFHRGEIHDSLRDLIPALANRIAGKGPKRDQLDEGDFWALKGVTFNVAPGQALGIIGANGAGKSTLLRILTKILRPSKGFCRIHGRVGALIEIAAGFHPDLTGRENVFLQGAIMGMPQAEIARKFDEIVTFSGISDFIDTPVKRYSTGMNARLGFSIAVHLDPEVLIIDEVLAVGDFSFQQRAFERLAALVRGGIPVVVVSHQLDRVAALCTDAIFLRRGEVAGSGTPAECISLYLRSAGVGLTDPEAPHPIRLESLIVATPGPIRSGSRVRVRVGGTTSGLSPDNPDMVALRFRVVSSGHALFVTSTKDHGVALPGDGDFELEFDLQANLPEGVYWIETVVWNPRLSADVVIGPSLLLEVARGLPFSGSVQMNPHFHLVGPAASDVPTKSAQ
jgi:ABC-type polysaccharide/polyol phosphate transport system ATPase subunit